MRSSKTTTTVNLAGEITQGGPVVPSTESVILPASILDKHELVYMAADSSLDAFDVLRGDLLIVKPKKKAETSELVIACLDDLIYVGRWWTKHGRRDVLDADAQRVIVCGASVLGVINLIVRSVHGR
jgi:SOS-response transcriptional repressor LexA